MKKNKKLIFVENCLPFIVFAIWITLMHFVAIMGTGDDAWFFKISHDANFNLIKWLESRYMTWSSRTLIEASLVISVSLPRICWRIADSAILILCMVMISKLFVRRNKFNNIFLGLLYLSLDYFALITAGWQATTINYLWPMAALFVSVYPMAKWIREEQIRPYEYIIYALANIYAVFSEQACVILIILYVSIGIYSLKKLHLNLGKFYGIQLLIDIAGLLNALFCPGNAKRNISEVATWFPEYKTFSVLQKIDLGISSTIKSLFLEKNVMFLLLLFTLTVIGWIRYKKLFYRIIMIFPFVFVLGLNVVRILFGNGSGLFRFVSTYGVLFEKTNHFLKVYIWYAFLLFMCLLIMIDILLVAKDTAKGLLIDLTFVIGLASKAMLGFSATVWASYSRTGWFCQIACLCCTIMLLETIEKDKKKIIYGLLIIFTFVAVVQMLYNYKYVFSVSL